MLQLDAIDREVLDRLHPSAIEGVSAVRELLTRVWRERVPLRQGLNRQITRELAEIVRIGSDTLQLKLVSFGSTRRTHLWLNFDLDERPYFFTAQVLDASDEHATARTPDLVYRAERRDRAREERLPGQAIRRALAHVDSSGLSQIDAEIADSSPSGFGIEVATAHALTVGASIALTLTDALGRESVWRGKVCYAGPSARPGWQRVGVSALGNGRHRAAPLIEPARSIPTWKQARRKWEAVAAGAAAQSGRLIDAVARRARSSPQVQIRDFWSNSGEHIRAIVDSYDIPGKAPAIVLIPPAWGRTKETLLPLAATIVETFKRAGEPVVVIRFDGIRRRGESFNDAACRSAGQEHHHFTFSQATSDVRTVIRELRADDRFASSKLVLVTFSAASIDGRRAVAEDVTGDIGAWISVVGSADLQSMMRVLSGGVDFVRGIDAGISFGFQEMLGVEVDIDRAGRDALSNHNAYLEDSCKDMEKVTIPVTWIHGRHDAWMDLERSRLMLSSGDSSRRRLIVVPTGHQLRSSREALEVFQLIAQEVSRLALGRELTPRVPNLNDLNLRRLAERSRLPKKAVDERAFWKQYLLGRDGSLGIELMTYSTPYVEFMKEQIEALLLSPGQRVGDFGAGTGAFLSSLGEIGGDAGLSIVHLDYVAEALEHARERVRDVAPSSRAEFVACDLSGNGRDLSVPIADSSFDRALASLFVSYVSDPHAVLREIHRTLRPGGVLVLSGLRRDADVSRLFIEATQEIAHGVGVNRLPSAGSVDLQRASREFLNDATRLVDLEELGIFEFRDGLELADLVERAGFQVKRVWKAFGDPPQAFILSATKASTN